MSRDLFKHTMEGDGEYRFRPVVELLSRASVDDMPAHVKSTLIGASVQVPITEGKLSLGTWQGIYLCEHRNTGGWGSGHDRTVVVTLSGQV